MCLRKTCPLETILYDGGIDINKENKPTANDENPNKETYTI